MSSKNCPESTRQKMINMMYLVLTAMLALNVASEVLESFRVIDASLNQTLNIVKRKNAQIYDAFTAADQDNHDKVKVWKGKSDAVKEKTKVLITKIIDLKEELVMGSGGIPKKEAGPDYVLSQGEATIVNSKGDTIIIKKEDDLNSPSLIMINRKKGLDLKTSIEGYREFLASFLDKDDRMRDNIIKQLDTTNPKAKLTEVGDKKTWESLNFENKPLIAIITLLSKMQIDIENAETNIISLFYSKIDAASFKFNRLTARIVPKSTYVIKGDQFEAEIYLAAIDTTKDPEVFVDGSKITMRDKRFIYSHTATEVGPQTYKGTIKYKNPDGNIIPLDFNGAYQVGAPSVTISPTKMNVLYLGIANPVKVSVPGIASENLSINVSNGRYEKSGDGYLVYPAKLDIMGKSTSISVTAKMGTETRSMGSMDFRVKEVPPPVATVSGKNGGILRKEDLQVEEGIFAELKDFDFDLKFHVTQFDITFAGPSGFVNIYKGTGNKFTKEQKNQFAKLTPGSVFIVDNISAKGDDGSNRTLSPISFKIR